MQSINIPVDLNKNVLTTCTFMFRLVCIIEPSFFKTTSGMYCRPFMGRHLVDYVIIFNRLYRPWYNFLTKLCVHPPNELEVFCLPFFTVYRASFWYTVECQHLVAFMKHSGIGLLQLLNSWHISLPPLLVIVSTSAAMASLFPSNKAMLLHALPNLRDQIGT